MMNSILIALGEKTREEILKHIAKAAAAGAVSDAVLALLTGENAAKEGAIGGVSTAAGVGVKEVLREFTEASKSQSILAGIGASIVTRHGLREITNPTPPSDDDDDEHEGPRIAHG